MYISKYILAWSGLAQFLEDHVISRVDGDILMSDLVSPKLSGSQLGRVTIRRHCVFRWSCHASTGYISCTMSQPLNSATDNHPPYCALFLQQELVLSKVDRLEEMVSVLAERNKVLEELIREMSLKLGTGADSMS